MLFKNIDHEKTGQVSPEAFFEIIKLYGITLESAAQQFLNKHYRINTSNGPRINYKWCIINLT